MIWERLDWRGCLTGMWSGWDGAIGWGGFVGYEGGQQVASEILLLNSVTVLFTRVT